MQCNRIPVGHGYACTGRAVLRRPHKASLERGCWPGTGPPPAPVSEWFCLRGRKYAPGEPLCAGGNKRRLVAKSGCCSLVKTFLGESVFEFHSLYRTQTWQCRGQAFWPFGTIEYGQWFFSSASCQFFGHINCKWLCFRLCSRAFWHIDRKGECLIWNLSAMAWFCPVGPTKEHD